MAITLKSFRETIAKIVGRKPSDRFQEILVDAAALGNVPAKTQKSRDYYRSVGAGESGADVVNNRKRAKTLPTIGKMYFFQYYPKFVETLPYHDRLPMIFPIDVINNGIMGINLHYLPLELRAILMDGLYSLSSDNDYDEKTRLRISYQLLNTTAKLSLFRPCVKKYLFNHVQSPFFEINSFEWDLALFLPVERFARGSSNPNPSITSLAQSQSLGKV